MYKNLTMFLFFHYTFFKSPAINNAEVAGESVALELPLLAIF